MKSGDILGGKYRLDREIGKGAMGAVWASLDLQTGRHVALKLILPQAEELRNNDLRQRLLREAKACWKLRHRNIVQIFDVGETPDGDPFLVLELLHGQTLGDMLKEKRRIEPTIAARIAAEIASALAEAHKEQVIHRDLKPANVFLHREEGTAEDAFVAKVLDFGVCKTLDSVDSIATQTGTAVGSPAYMSPEQVGMRKDLDHRTDIWSLGIVLYEMLTGSRPFTGSVQEVVRHILLTPVPPPTSKVRDVPEGLDAIVARCTAPKRTDRYANADEVAAALRPIMGLPRAMTRKPTFTGMNAVAAAAAVPAPAPSAPSAPAPFVPAAPQPIIAHQEPPAVFVPMDSTIPMGKAPARTAPAVMAEDESDLAATMPLQGRMLANIRRTVATSGPPDERATGTQILPADVPLVSPAPAWNREEMKQALEQHRQSSMDLGALVQQELAANNGQTQMVTPAMMPGSAGRFDPTGTTSAAGALSQGTGGYPAPPMSLVDLAAASGRRKRSKRVFFGVMGVGVVGALGVMSLLVLNADKLSGVEATPAASGMNQESANLPMPPVKAADAPPNVEAPKQAPSAAPDPVATAAAPVVDKPPSTPPAATTSKASPVVKTALPVQKPPPPKKGPVCTGIGLFKQCK